MVRVIIVGDDRGGLRDAVALGYAGVEALEPGLLCGRFEFFAALHEEAHRREVVVVARGLRVAGKEGIRRE
ncbi:hypothetical protein SDC9_186930 [bioreactor metagenome]|uniref:Uncharacterized protein n=1 Tax=bioreactor metagenome TaxID=1076179 RepID=A0A645HLT3_9ZZZZ